VGMYVPVPTWCRPLEITPIIQASIMGLLPNGDDLLDINPYVQQAIIGAVIIIAVALDEARKRRFSA